MASTLGGEFGKELFGKGMWIPAIAGAIVAGPIGVVGGLMASILIASQAIEKLGEKERREQQKRKDS